MNIPAFNPPNPGAINVRTFQDLRSFLMNYVVNRWMQGVQTYMNSTLLPPLNMSQFGFGPDIASASSITPSAQVQHVTGSTAIDTINAPTAPQNLAGPIFLTSQDGFTTTTAGNIMQAVTIPAGHMGIFAYHPALQKWGVVTS